MTRRRRRVLIVLTTMAVAVASVWRGTRPYLDPRLLGQWRERGYVFWGSSYIFRDDGVLIGFGWNETSGSYGVGGEFNWRVSGDKLILDSPIDQEGFRSFVYSIYRRFRRIESYRFQIVELTSDQMILRACNDNDPAQTETTTYFRAEQ